MPTYEYRCSDCDHEFEIVQKFSDDALTTCPECEGGLRKVFSPVGVVFKGSGFYATDNRTKGSSSSASSSTSGEGKAEKPSGKGEKKKHHKKDAPAAAPAAASSASATG